MIFQQPFETLAQTAKSATPNWRTPAVTSRLPHVGTTIFTTMSALAAEHKAVNLGQGFPDFECDPTLVNLVNAAMQKGLNQYPPMIGVAALREAVAEKMQRLYGHTVNAQTEITITAGATQAIITTVLAIVHPGDEVIVLDPLLRQLRPEHRVGGWQGGSCAVVARHVSPRL